MRDEERAVERIKGQFDLSLLEKLKEKKSLGKLIYPVGSIYLTATAESPSSLFGGEWSLTGTQVFGGELCCYWKRTM